MNKLITADTYPKYREYMKEFQKEMLPSFGSPLDEILYIQDAFKPKSISKFTVPKILKIEIKSKRKIKKNKEEDKSLLEVSQKLSDFWRKLNAL